MLNSTHKLHNLCNKNLYFRRLCYSDLIYVEMTREYDFKVTNGNYRQNSQETNEPAANILGIYIVTYPSIESC